MTRFRPTGAAALLLPLLLSTAPGVLAVPNVTAVPLGATNCMGWPGFQGSSSRVDVSAGLDFILDQTEDGYDGPLSTTTPYFWPGDFNFTAVTFDLRKSNPVARNFFQCHNAAMLSFNTDTHIVINKDFRNAFMMLDNSDMTHGYPLEPYAHVDPATGKQLPGVFLGTQNQTVWGFNFAANNGKECRHPFLEARLQGLPYHNGTETRATYPPEFYGFIKAIQK